MSHSLAAPSHGIARKGWRLIARVERIEALGEKLASVDVRWAALGADGAERSYERSRDVLGAADEDSICIRVAVSLPMHPV